MWLATHCSGAWFFCGLYIFGGARSNQGPALRSASKPMVTAQPQPASSNDALSAQHQTERADSATHTEPTFEHTVDPILEKFRNQVQDDVAKLRCLPSHNDDVTCWARVTFRSGNDLATIDAILLAGCWTTIDQNERETLTPAATAAIQHYLTTSLATLPAYSRTVATPSELDVIIDSYAG